MRLRFVLLLLSVMTAFISTWIIVYVATNYPVGMPHTSDAIGLYFFLCFAIFFIPAHVQIHMQARRHFRTMLMSYQVADVPRSESWFWLVTVAPLTQSAENIRLLFMSSVNRLYHWLSFRVLEKSSLMTLEDVTILILTGGIVGGCMAVLTSGDNVTVATGIVVGILIAGATMRRRNFVRKNAFSDQLPVVLSSMITALRAGHSLSQAFSNVVSQTADPSRSEFVIVTQKLRLGVEFTRAIQDLAQRVDNDDLKLFVSALIIQHETGGNLVPMLETIYQTVRDRNAFNREMSALTAQQRMEARVITGLPFVLFGALAVFNPSSVSFFWTDQPLGPGLIGATLALILIGNAIISRIQVIR